MYNYVYISSLYCPSNMEYIFVISSFFVCLYGDHDFTNASLYLCLFLYIYAPVYHCVKSVHIQSYSSPYFLAFGLNTKRYFAVYVLKC